MSTTDTRSGFRLPWSSDRSRDDGPQAEAATASPEHAELDAVDAPVLSDGSDVASDESWPEVDVAARLRNASVADDARPPHGITQESTPMADPFAARTFARAAPRKPSKLMTDLVAAMRATAEVAREQALSQVEADARQVSEEIRKGATDGSDALRQRSDQDIASIREWSKAEIARVREQTDFRIAERKAALEAEIAAHAADIDHRVEQVNAAVAAYEAEMAAFFERLLAEEDPARLATLAEQMPEPPVIGALADETATSRVMTSEETEIEAATWAAEAAATAEAEAETIDAESVETEAEAEAVEAPPAGEAHPAGDPWGETDTLGGGFGASPWGGEDALGGEAGGPGAGLDAEAAPDVARWSAGDDDTPVTPDSGGGAPVDRGSIMAALEAAAEAVVAAEAAAESADQAEAAADVAETAAELIVGRVDSDEATGEEAEAALSARMDAGGLDAEPSLADRLASLLPGAGSADDATPVTTQVVVSGLVSVASIASFKRHVGRIHGVQSVTVASGPDGEFVFNVTHRGDAGLREAIPSLPGFGARVTGTGDGVLAVAARDPETDG